MSTTETRSPSSPGPPARPVPRLAADPGTVMVYSDIGCPWASLALHHLRGAIRETGVDLAIDHRVFPLELFNSRPTPKRILDPEVAALADLEPALGWSGWTAPESAYAVSMLPAMEAVQAAKDPAVGGLRASDQLDAALRRAFYAESRCISVHPEIIAAARECPLVDAGALDRALRHGTHRQAVFAQWEIAATDAVQGSPHLFLSDASGMHNPGISFTWPSGHPGPTIHDYRPEIWRDLVHRAARTES